MKMPAPTMPPMTIMVASNSPIWRSSPGAAPLDVGGWLVGSFKSRVSNSKCG